jgi:GTP-binding protein EngB required for normal cell division
MQESVVTFDGRAQAEGAGPEGNGRTKHRAGARPAPTAAGRTAQVREQFREFFEAFDAVLPYHPLDETTRKHIEQKRSWMGRLEQVDFPVAFLGSFSAGKSTIINAIVGREVLPEASKAATAIPTFIRRGDKDRAYIHYADEAGKLALWAQLTVEVGEKIEQDLTQQPQEERARHLERMSGRVTEYERKTNNEKIDRAPLHALEKLFRGWDTERYRQTREITLDELKQYVEGHEDVLFITQIEAFVKDIDLPEDVVLLDLPGLAVANTRHVQFTREYIEHRAKAFVVCIKGMHLLEGQELELLEEINRRNPTILQRSFWVLNRWDDLNEQHRREEVKNFREKVKRFRITDERFFKFSALNYFLLRSIADGTLERTAKLKEHKSNLIKMPNVDLDALTPETARALLRDEQVKPFGDFREALFQYLNTTAKEEFLANALGELAHVAGLLEKELKSDFHRLDRNEDVAERVRAEESYRQMALFLEDITGRIKKFAGQLVAASREELWTAGHTAEVERELSEALLRLDRKELGRRLRGGPDADGVISRLPAIVEERLQVSLLLREKLASVVGGLFEQHLRALLTQLKELNNGYLPDAVLEELEGRLSVRDLSMRLQGLGDSLFFDFGEMFDQIGRQLWEAQDEEFDERVGAALEKYQQETVGITRKLVARLNLYAQRGLKNHAEMLERELLRTLHLRRASVLSKVSRRLNISETVALEERRRDIIRQTYLKLVNLGAYPGRADAAAPPAAEREGALTDAG